MKLWVRSLALLSGLRIQCCHELWCRSQTQLRSQVSVVVAGSYSSNSTPSLGTFICRGCGPRKKCTKKRSPKNIYLKICSSSFPRAQSASLLVSTLGSTGGAVGSAASVAHVLLHVEANGRCQTSVHERKSRSSRHG